MESSGRLWVEEFNGLNTELNKASVALKCVHNKTPENSDSWTSPLGNCSDYNKSSKSSFFVWKKYKQKEQICQELNVHEMLVDLDRTVHDLIDDLVGFAHMYLATFVPPSSPGSKAILPMDPKNVLSGVSEPIRDWNEKVFSL